MSPHSYLLGEESKAKLVSKTAGISTQVRGTTRAMFFSTEDTMHFSIMWLQKGGVGGPCPLFFNLHSPQSHQDQIQM